MGRWYIGNFENDEALDYLAQMVEELQDKIEDWFDNDDAHIEYEGEGMVMPSVAIINILCEQCHGAPPKPEVVKKWRMEYLRLYDEQIEEVDEDEEFKRLRREEIAKTFEQLEKQAKGFWDKISSSKDGTRGARDGGKADTDTATPPRVVAAATQAKPASTAAPAAKKAAVYDYGEERDHDLESMNNLRIPSRRFEYQEGTSSKFWEIEYHNKSFTVTFGRIGTKGQLQVKHFDSTWKAKAEYEKLIEEKLKKGYEEVDNG